MRSLSSYHPVIPHWLIGLIVPALLLTTPSITVGDHPASARPCQFGISVPAAGRACLIVPAELGAIPDEPFYCDIDVLPEQSGRSRLPDASPA